MDLWHQLAVAFALVLIIEGLLPFLAPGSWRRVIQTVSNLDDSSVRGAGLVSMLLGLGLLYVFN